ncbi:MAG: hypothetical protein U9O96_04620 [Candidatus Thermoplasmatota archaeon]|nr:hypothetical protein [Candidatus Thermoplasmatota archaeon]
MNSKPCVVLLIFIVLSTIFPASIGQERSVYHQLFQMELSEISAMYENESVPGYESFVKAKENGGKYPFYSYKLLVKCFASIWMENATAMLKSMGNESACNLLLADVQQNFSEISEEFNGTTPKSIASMEWLALAEKNVREAKGFINKSASHLEKEGYTLALLSGIQAKSLLHKAEDFIEIAYTRNNASQVNETDIKNASEFIASRWIELAETAVEYVESFGGAAKARNLLEEAKGYCKAESYYLALMKASHAKSLAEYLTAHPGFNTRDEALKMCRTYLEYANLSLSRVYKEPTVDAPFAEMTIELAELHLKDAEKEESEGGAMAIASLSIKEALGAREQAVAALDLKKALGISFQEESKADFPWGEVALIVVVASVIFLAALYIKRKK